MDPKELLEHELAHYKKIAKLRLLGHWSAKVGGKRMTVIVYKVNFYRSHKVGNYQTSTKPKHRVAVSYGERIIASVVLES